MTEKCIIAYLIPTLSPVIYIPLPPSGSVCETSDVYVCMCVYVCLRVVARLEAQSAAAPGRLRWGGVWKADRSHTLTGVTSNQSSIREITFDVWPAGPRVPQDVVPWINRGAHPKREPLLTASVTSDVYWWGSVIADVTGTGATSWIAYTEADRPDTVLYWIRED